MRQLFRNLPPRMVSRKCVRQSSALSTLPIAAAMPPSAITVCALPSSDLQTTPTRAPLASASIAARRPAPPAPMINTSYSCVSYLALTGVEYPLSLRPPRAGCRDPPSLRKPGCTTQTACVVHSAWSECSTRYASGDQTLNTKSSPYGRRKDGAPSGNRACKAKAERYSPATPGSPHPRQSARWNQTPQWRRTRAQSEKRSQCRTCSDGCSAEGRESVFRSCICARAPRPPHRKADPEKLLCCILSLCIITSPGSLLPRLVSISPVTMSSNDAGGQLAANKRAK